MARVRVSPGVYRDDGKGSTAAKKPAAFPKPTYEPGLMSLGGAIQTQQNMNNLNQVNPWGSVNYSRGPDGQVTQNTSLSAPQQQMLDFGNTLGNQVRDQFGRPLSFDGLPQAPDVNKFMPADNFAAERQRVSDTMYGRDKSVLDKQFGDEEAQMRQQLANQGIEYGNAKYDRYMQDFNKRKESAYADARQRADLGGGEEQNRLFGLGQQGFNLQTTARDNARNDLMTMRNQPMQDYQSVMGTIQAPQAEGYRPVDIGGAGGFAMSAYDWAKGPVNRGGSGGRGRGSSGPQILGSFDPLAGMSMPQQPKPPSMGSQILGSLGAGLAQGFGMGLGSGKWF